MGISSIEHHATNVCGLAPERLLRECRFAPELLFSEPLRVDCAVGAGDGVDSELSVRLRNRVGRLREWLGPSFVLWAGK